MKYNHNGDSIKEATGVDPEKIAEKAAILAEGKELDSKYIEQVENHFSKRELAVMAFLFIYEMDQKNSVPSDVKMIKIDPENMPEGMEEFLTGIIESKMQEDEAPTKKEHIIYMGEPGKA